jgi:hypothetical protein
MRHNAEEIRAAKKTKTHSTNSDNYSLLSRPTKTASITTTQQSLTHMSYQQPVPLHSGSGRPEKLSVERPPEATKTPDPSAHFISNLKRRPSANYQTALLDNQFQSTHISKATPPASTEHENRAEFPFKSCYHATPQTHNYHRSGANSPDEALKWSPETAKRSLQRGSVDLSNEKDLDEDACVEYGFGNYKKQQQQPEATQQQSQQQPRKTSRGDSVYHSNQFGHGSTGSLGRKNSSGEYVNPSGFEYDEFKRRMQHD